ncbi:MOSC domain-containing protein [Persicitalea jodogahamensis]|uniref:Molybdenum cofactor biosysynthesis protein n=1 Tax=Persicitalea jodogahamensis TaxID=402147 RepID=A0A8J3D2Q1_9BACT|nr:MOSC domain-containing protein [Persicitalea jodogahamensis]GHB60513.1 molybdenum cofactor biosysynthesis protein [Persicitalea jodogahamensis]
MQIHSVNVGLPRTVEWEGRIVTTGIFKEPVTGPIPLNFVNLQGDRQADLTVHGGPDKAVYAYDLTHYAVWKSEIARSDWTPGLFGENLTTEGLLESEVRIGDLFRAGTALLRAVQPRFPCYKLNVRFDDPGMTRRFAQLGRPGIYFRVVEPGIIAAGDALALTEAAETDVTIQTVNDVVLKQKGDYELVARLASLPHLAESLRAKFSNHVSRQQSQDKLS